MLLLVVVVAMRGPFTALVFPAAGFLGGIFLGGPACSLGRNMWERLLCSLHAKAQTLKASSCLSST